ncbi:hypothetical protein PAF17_10415 [Paracoccus sp. Z330]|uniref:CopG family transcriptional regulator n=1 Tax=Paracoccus onchidii TaxID=3017813 RepID=A0ABT4ZEW8_9RHOB|nr:hypothetical protein [Paracoccus onchidii]MDB6177913.1 hypothetical protein [Paracoccus onchidii]
MNSYHISLDESADRRLHAIAQKLGRSVESLIESAAEEAALDHFRHSANDPARTHRHPDPVQGDEYCWACHYAGDCGCGKAV